MRILIIEDEASVAEAFKKYLGDLDSGAEFTVAESLADGLLEAVTETFDLVLLDLNLPDSQECQKTIERCSAVMRKIPTMVVTGYGDAHTGLFAIEKGAIAFVVKSDLDSLKQAFLDFKNRKVVQA